jgi:tRNA nucleotidyltransferase (CCA-adding enzyme)
MKRELAKLPQGLQDLIKKIHDLAVTEKVKAYLVGGFVRDIILKVGNFDLDIVIEGDGTRFAESFAGFMGAKVTIHKHFGTATVRIHSGHKVDFSSARKEIYPKPGSLPVVSFGSLRVDLFRRDFTINAMAIDLRYGKLFDYYGGRNDLEHKRIRILHPLSFIDDPTRILRAIRFEQRLGFKIEPKTLKLLKEAVQMNMLFKVHPHRLRDDLILILKEEDPLKEIKRLKELVGFDFITKGLKVDEKKYTFLKVLKKEISWFNNNYPKRRSIEAWLIYLMGLLDSLEAKEIKALCLTLGLRKGEEIRLLSFKQMNKNDIEDLSRVAIKPSHIFSILEPLSYETIIALKARHRNPVFRKHVEDFLEIYNGMRIFVSGEDLHGLGVVPGPKYQKIFSQVLHAKLNGLVKTKSEELALIKRLLNKGARYV